MEIWMTSDTHFSHNKSFLFKPRGFNSVEEMNENIVERWNNIVKENDIIFHLGDVALINTEEAINYIKILKGNIKWIRGNHCTESKIQMICKYCSNIQLIGNINTSWAYMLKYSKFSLYLSHYPTLTANFDDKKFSQHVINLHGHTHQQTNFLNPTNPFMYHVGLDSHDYTPVHIDNVIADIRQRWEDIGKLPTPVIPEDNYPYDKVFTQNTKEK